MPPVRERSVLVLDDALPRWQVANIATVLGATLGARGVVELGVALTDAAGIRHEAIAEATVPVLAATSEDLAELVTAAPGRGLLVLDFNTAARDSRNYEEYERALEREPPSPLGAVVHGEAAAVTSLTGNLRSLR